MRRDHKKSNGPGKYKADVKKSDGGSETTNTHTPEDPDVPTPPNTDDASNLRIWHGMVLTGAVLFDISPVKYKRRNMA